MDLTIMLTTPCLQKWEKFDQAWLSWKMSIFLGWVHLQYTFLICLLTEAIQTSCFKTVYNLLGNLTVVIDSGCGWRYYYSSKYAERENLSNLNNVIQERIRSRKVVQMTFSPKFMEILRTSYESVFVAMLLISKRSGKPWSLNKFNL